MSLKNESIDVIKRFDPTAFVNRSFEDTNKGTVAHMRAPTDSVKRADEYAIPAWVILPQYKAGSSSRLVKNSPGRSFMWLAENSFNYSVLGKNGFTGVAELVDHCDCYQYGYSDLEDAIAIFDELADSK